MSFMSQQIPRPSAINRSKKTRRPLQISRRSPVLVCLACIGLVLKIRVSRPIRSSHDWKEGNVSGLGPQSLTRLLTLRRLEYTAPTRPTDPFGRHILFVVFPSARALPATGLYRSLEERHHPKMMPENHVHTSCLHQTMVSTLSLMATTLVMVCWSSVKRTSQTISRASSKKMRHSMPSSPWNLHCSSWTSWFSATCAMSDFGGLSAHAAHEAMERTKASANSNLLFMGTSQGSGKDG